eukprot:3075623-Amphidinium_carterae.1
MKEQSKLCTDCSDTQCWSFAEIHLSSEVGNCILPPPEKTAVLTNIECNEEVLQCEEAEDVDDVSNPWDSNKCKSFLWQQSNNPPH